VLPRGRLAAAQHTGDLGERHAERVVQHERHALLRREPVQHDHRRQPDVLTLHGELERIVLARSVQRRRDRFRQPWPHVGLAASGGRTQPVQADPADHGRRPCGELADAVAFGRLQRLQPQPRLLHRVLGVRSGAGQSIGECQQPPA